MIAAFLLMFTAAPAMAEPAPDPDAEPSPSDPAPIEDPEPEGDSDPGDESDPEDTENGIPTPNIDWRACFSTFEELDEIFGEFPPEAREELEQLLAESDFECAEVDVPLDYDEPEGEQIELAMVRRLANDQDNKIGSLFTNPGGPGGSGIGLAIFAPAIVFDAEVLDRFDILGIDPRGIGRSTGLSCINTIEELQEFAEFIPVDPFPTDLDGVKEQKEFSQEIARRCEENAGPIIDHMSTANVARDFEAIRKGVGDDGFNYVGYSYGTQLGMTYANLFPENVRALVIDGNLPAASWSRGANAYERYLVPFTTRIDSAIGDRDTFAEWARLCDENPETCPLAPNAAARANAVIDAVDDEPFPIVDPETGETVGEINAPFLVAATAGALRSTDSYQFLALFYSDIEAILESAPAEPAEPAEPATPSANAATRAAVAPADMKALHDDMAALVEIGEAPYIGPQSYVPADEPFQPLFGEESFFGVSCAETENPRLFAAWPFAAHQSEREQGRFGPLWTWSSAPCADWTGTDDDAFRGPYDATPANTVLVVNNRFDGPTPYQNALANVESLGNATLLTVNGWGHVSAGTSTCGTTVVSDYLTSGEAPESNVECEPDFVPFQDDEPLTEPPQ